MAQYTEERRRYPRFKLFCPVKLLGESGKLLAEAQTLDISDGGMLVLLPSGPAPAIGTVLAVRLHVPSSASDSGEMRQFSCQGRVLRHANIGPGKRIALAIEFLGPVQFDLGR